MLTMMLDFLSRKNTLQHHSKKDKNDLNLFFHSFTDFFIFLIKLLLKTYLNNVE